MINGAHIIIYSANAEADRAFLRDVLELPSTDSGEGWLIFGLPPAEAAVHPAEVNGVHEFFLICDDVEAFVSRMQGLNVRCEPVKDLNWGRLTYLTLPGGGKVGVYEARHARPEERTLTAKDTKNAKERFRKKLPEKRLRERTLTTKDTKGHEGKD